MRTQIDEGEIDIHISGTRQEFRELYDELHTWTPHGGWSPEAKQLFRELARAGGMAVDED